jgi:hypothetical protein
MIILKSLGAFFVKIWRWIKDTAWVQPLLIVGAIFAIIFSIPSITSWANSWSGTATNSFYNAKKKTLEGEGIDQTDLSEADKLTQSIYKNSLVPNVTSQDQLDVTNGKKFFLIYANSSNSTSNSYESGFKYLRDYWGKQGLISEDKEDFNYFTIFSDDTSENDKDIDTNLGDAWERYLKNNLDFFNSSIERLEAAPYYANASMTEDNYLKFALSDVAADKKASSVFMIPTICLVDYTQEAISANRYGLSEILFSLDGTTDTQKAQNLMNMWNHLSTSSTTNPFSTSYIK